DPTSTVPAVRMQAIVQGVFYEDKNGNGVKDGGELPYPGQTVYLYRWTNNSWVPVMKDGKYVVCTTDSQGFYYFVVEIGEQYRVVFPKVAPHSTSGTGVLLGIANLLGLVAYAGETTDAPPPTDGTFIDVSTDTPGEVIDGSHGVTHDIYYTVTFVNGYGGTISTVSVLQGGNASPPAAPAREGYQFNGWSGVYTNVTSNETVTALWVKDSVTTVNVPADNITVEPTPVTVNVPAQKTPTVTVNEAENPTPTVNVSPPAVSVTTPATSGGNTYVSAPPATVVVEQAAAPATIKEEDPPLEAEPEEPVEEVIEEPEVPLAAPAGWHLLDVILAIIAVVFGLLLLWAGLKRRDEDNEDIEYEAQNNRTQSTRTAYGMTGIGLAIATVVILVVTQAFDGPMLLADMWAIVFAIIVVMQFIVMRSMPTYRLNEDYGGSDDDGSGGGLGYEDPFAPQPQVQAQQQ
ncbi:MAG: InlB B-repeat-containing protein, partial [Clostridiales Family XIII bacterium]|nr:InlB B-repeat-containing protein [Clostridiales Family XIII bacterium]